MVGQRQMLWMARKSLCAPVGLSNDGDGSVGLAHVVVVPVAVASRSSLLRVVLGLAAAPPEEENEADDGDDSSGNSSSDGTDRSRLAVGGRGVGEAADVPDDGRVDDGCDAGRGLRNNTPRKKNEPQK